MGQRAQRCRRSPGLFGRGHWCWCRSAAQQAGDPCQNIHHRQPHTGQQHEQPKGGPSRGPVIRRGLRRAQPSCCKGLRQLICHRRQTAHTTMPAGRKDRDRARNSQQGEQAVAPARRGSDTARRRAVTWRRMSYCMASKAGTKSSTKQPEAKAINQRDHGWFQELRLADGSEQRHQANHRGQRCQHHRTQTIGGRINNSRQPRSREYSSTVVTSTSNLMMMPVMPIKPITVNIDRGKLHSTCP